MGEQLGHRWRELRWQRGEQTLQLGPSRVVDCKGTTIGALELGGSDGLDYERFAWLSYLAARLYAAIVYGG